MKQPRPKKSLGQNFLVDQGVVSSIVSASGIRPGERVLEIGPGLGALTESLLAAGAEVLAVEVDPRMAEALRARLGADKRLALIEGDILTKDISDQLAPDRGPYKVVANLPYYITAPILRRLLSFSPQAEQLVLMVQKEVGERLAAAPGNTSLLSIMAQYYADVELLFIVPKEAFSPVPKVDSAVIRLIPKRAFAADADRALFRIVRAGFAARRKTLANNLAALLPLAKPDIEVLLVAGLGLKKDVRAQALSIDEWMRLKAILEEKIGTNAETAPTREQG